MVSKNSYTLLWTACALFCTLQRVPRDCCLHTTSGQWVIMEDDFVVVANTKGKADIWRHFGLKKRKHDGTVAVCKTCTIKTSGCTTNMTTHLRRYHPQLLSSGSMQAKSTPNLHPLIKQLPAQLLEWLNLQASNGDSRLWSKTHHQLEQTVSADSVEPDTSATPPQLPAVNLAAEETPWNLWKWISCSRTGEPQKHQRACWTLFWQTYMSHTWSPPRTRISWLLKKLNGSEKNQISRWKTILWFGWRWTFLAFSYWEDWHRCTWPFPPQVSPLNESSRQQETLWPPRGPTWSRSKLNNWSS